jgi:hypothetical protein
VPVRRRRTRLSMRDGRSCQPSQQQKQAAARCRVHRVVDRTSLSGCLLVSVCPLRCRTDCNCRSRVHLHLSVHLTSSASYAPRERHRKDIDDVDGLSGRDHVPANVTCTTHHQHPCVGPRCIPYARHIWLTKEEEDEET